MHAADRVRGSGPQALHRRLAEEPTQLPDATADAWNRCCIRGINGEVWRCVNGTEVSGGNTYHPAAGCLALEAERAQVEFRNLRIRELP